MPRLFLERFGLHRKALPLSEQPAQPASPGRRWGVRGLLFGALVALNARAVPFAMRTTALAAETRDIDADFDGDGDQDLLISSDVVTLLRNDGAANFGSPVTVFSNVSAVSSTVLPERSTDSPSES